MKLNKPKEQHIKNVFKSEETNEKTKDRIIREIRILFDTEEERKKEIGKNIMKDRLNKVIRTLFEQEGED